VTHIVGASGFTRFSQHLSPLPLYPILTSLIVTRIQTSLEIQCYFNSTSLKGSVLFVPTQRHALPFVMPDCSLRIQCSVFLIENF